MKFSTLKMLVPLALIAIAAIGVGGCGGDDNDTTATESEETSAGTTGETGSGAGKTVEIKMGDYYFAPQNATLEAGKTTIEAPNEGSVEHELVLFESNTNPAELPTDANGDVDEEKLEQEGGEEVGEIEDVEPGDTKSAEFNLKPGKYVMFCNLPGHYTRGMYGALTVE